MPRESPTAPSLGNGTLMETFAMNDNSTAVTSFHLPKAVAELFEHLSRAIYSLSFSEGLNPAQWNALRYLNRANPSSRTMSAFARFPCHDPQHGVADLGGACAQEADQEGARSR